MNSKNTSNIYLLKTILLLSTLHAEAAVVVQPGPCSNIQNAINALPAAGGAVVLTTGTYTCTAPITIARNSISLRGEGPSTLIILANHSNTPLIIVGQSVNEPTLTYSNIQISDLVVDGNRANQDYECWSNDCAKVRNNGISVRRSNNVVIERVTTRRASSGGVVVEKGSRQITIRDLISYENEFDGVAAYRTENSIFSGLQLYNNCFAGLSFDLGFHNNTVSDVNIFRTAGSITCLELNVPVGTFGTVGIFMRDAIGNIFHDIRIRNTREHGVFIAEVSPNTGIVKSNIFEGIVVRDIAYNNCFAGLSFDLGFHNNTVSDVNIFRTAGSITCLELNVPVGTFGTVGIFMRDAIGNIFHNVRIRNTREHGVFIAEVSPNTGIVKSNIFEGIVVRDVANASMNGFRVNSASCINNILYNAHFINNAGTDLIGIAPIRFGGICTKQGCFYH